MGCFDQIFELLVSRKTKQKQIIQKVNLITFHTQYIELMKYYGSKRQTYVNPDPLGGHLLILSYSSLRKP